MSCTIMILCKNEGMYVGNASNYSLLVIISVPCAVFKAPFIINCKCAMCFSSSVAS